MLIKVINDNVKVTAISQRLKIRGYELWNIIYRLYKMKTFYFAKVNVSFHVKVADRHCLFVTFEAFLSSAYISPRFPTWSAFVEGIFLHSSSRYSKF